MKINREQVMAGVMQTLLSGFRGHGETLIIAEVDGVEKEGMMNIQGSGDDKIVFSIRFPDEGDGYTLKGTIDVVLPWDHAFHK